MKVCDLPYQRVTLEKIKPIMTALIQKIEQATDVSTILAARQEYIALTKEYVTASSLSYTRYTLNTADPFYLAEKDYYDEIGPQVEALVQQYESAMLKSPLRPQLEKELNPLLFKSFEMDQRAMAPQIVDDMVAENKIVTEYSQLMAGMEFEFRGTKMPRSMLMKYSMSGDRNTRKECYDALGADLSAHQKQLDDIFDRLVHIRNQMAQKMGYANFIEMGYCRMHRLCYDQKMVETFRQNVLQDIVPVVTRLRKHIADKLGLGQMMLYDNDVVLPNGDPKPCDKAGIFKGAKEMYEAMGPKTGAFFNMMLENEAFDVDSRNNKWGGGYEIEFPIYKQPFILANFNGTSGDVGVVTHEAGHAFNSWLCFDNPYATDLQPGMETAETHSMSMEFFTWPYMEKFFGDKAGQYRYLHIVSALSFIPYGTIVDAFQHIVYENPDLTPAQRNQAWNDLEAKYRPYLSSKGIPYLENGTRWQYQMHIFESPFYYIDYVLAQTAAFQFLIASRADYNDAFNRYVALSQKGGEAVFTDLLKQAGLQSPFEPGALKTMAQQIEKVLAEVTE
jgi:M3 family oligoendopeptidase